MKIIVILFITTRYYINSLIKNHKYVNNNVMQKTVYNSIYKTTFIVQLEHNVHNQLQQMAILLVIFIDNKMLINVLMNVTIKFIFQLNKKQKIRFVQNNKIVHMLLMKLQNINLLIIQQVTVNKTAINLMYSYNMKQKSIVNLD